VLKEPLSLPGPLTLAEQRVVDAVSVAAIAAGDAPDRPVRAGVLAALCVAAESAGQSGVHVKGARIVGPLELRWTKLEAPLVLEDCRIEGPVHLTDAQLPALTFRGCTLLEKITAQRIDVAGCLEVVDCTCHGAVLMYDAKVGADLDFSGTVFHEKGSAALDAAGIDVGADVLLDRVDAHGDVAFQHAEVGRSLSAVGATLRRSSDAALSLDAAEVKGRLYLTSNRSVETPPRFTAHGGVSLVAADIGRDIDLDGARLEQQEGQAGALNAERAKIGGIVTLGCIAAADGVLRQDPEDRPLRFEADGTILLRDASVGELFLHGARVTAPDEAIGADRLRVAGNLVFTPPLPVAGKRVRDRAGAPVVTEIGGETRLIAAQVGGDVYFDAAQLRHATGDALSADQLSAQQITFRTVPDPDGAPLRFRAEGAVRLPGARLTGRLDLRGARLVKPGGIALRAFGAEAVDVLLDYAIDEHDALICDADGAPVAFHATGGVSLRDVKVGNKLAMGGALLDGADDIALDARGLHADDVSLARVYAGDVPVPGDGGHFTANKPVRFDAAEITNDLDLCEARFGAVGKTAFDAPRMRVGGRLIWQKVRCTGGASLHDATAGALVDDVAGWPDKVDLDGFRYEAIDGDHDWQKRCTWLQRQPRYATRAHRHLAKLYRDAGDDKAARQISIAQFNEQLRRPDGGLSKRAWLWRRILQGTIGHGYAPWRAGYIALALWAIGWIVICAAVNDGAVVAQTSAPVEEPKKPFNAQGCKETRYACVQEWRYSADLLVPVVNLGQRDKWRITEGWGAIVPLFTILGWMLTTLVVAGFTGLVRRE
jgi:hypothetical protein